VGILQYGNKEGGREIGIVLISPYKTFIGEKNNTPPRAVKLIGREEEREEGRLTGA
jgi:hypothetical protein